MKWITNSIVSIVSIAFLGVALMVCFSQSVSAEVVDRIVAIVNADIITLVELDRGAAAYINGINASGYSDEKKKQMIREARTRILHSMIDQSLGRYEAKRYNLTVSETEIDASVKNVMEKELLSIEEFKEALALEGLTLETYRENIKNQIMQARLINFAVKAKVVITESDIKKVYDADAAKYAGTKKYYLRNIIMDNKEKIGEVKKKLDQNNAFIPLAKQYSMAPNAQDGGDLGLFDIENFSENIKKSLLDAKKGGHTDVVPTTQGFQIFFIEDIVLDEHKSMEQTHDEIRESLYRIEVEKKYNTWIDSLKKNAHIKIML